MAARLNEGVCKTIEEARVEEMCKKIKEEVTTKLKAQFNSEWTHKEVALNNELAAEKAAWK